MKKLLSITAIIMAALLVLGLAAFVMILYPRVIEPENAYSRAQFFEESGDHLRAAMSFDSISGYKDSMARAKESWLAAGDANLENGNPNAAYACYMNAGADKEHLKRIDESYFELGKAAYENEDDSAEVYFDSIKSDELTAQMDEVRINAARNLITSGEYEAAERILSFCSEASGDTRGELWFNFGSECVKRSSFKDAYYCFNCAKNSVDDDGLNDMLERINNEWSSVMLDVLTSGGENLISEFNKYSSMFEESSVIGERDKLRYEEAASAYDSGDFARALALLRNISKGYGNSAEMLEYINERLLHSASAGGTGLGAVLDLNGNIHLIGNKWTISEPNWVNIESIAVGKEAFILGVRSNGTVVAKGLSSYNRTEVADWKNIISVACGQYHSVGLTRNGRVVSCGWNYYGQGMTDSWRNIKAIACGSNTTYGLTESGRVLAAGDNSSGQLNVSAWNGIKAIAAGNNHIVGINEDGTVAAVGSNNKGQCNVENWHDIVGVAAGDGHTVGLRADGTLVAVGDNSYGQCDVLEFTGVIAVAAGEGFTIIMFNNGEFTVIGDIAANE